MNSRTTVFMRIGELLDECKECPKNKTFNHGNRKSAETVCKGCSIYDELRKLGDSMIKDGDQPQKEPDEKKLQLSVEDYKTFRSNGYLDREIAKVKKVSKNTLSAWKKEHEGELKMDPMLSVDEYKDLREKLKTDSNICLKIGIERIDLREWKKAHVDELKDIPMCGPNPGGQPSPNAKVAKKMSDKLKTADAEIDRLKNELKDAKENNGDGGKVEYKEMKDKLLANISELTDKLKDSDELKSKAEEENERLNFEIGHREAEINDLKAELKHVREDHSNLNNAADDMERETAQLREENDALKQKYDRLSWEYKSTHEDYVKYFNKYQRSQAVLHALKEYVAVELKGEIEERA